MRLDAPLTPPPVGPRDGPQGRLCGFGRGATFDIQAGARGAGPSLDMRTTRQISAIVAAGLGVALVVYGASGGLWPLSLQLIAGVLLLVYAALRWPRQG